MGTTITLNSRRLSIIWRRIPAIYNVVIPHYDCPPAHPWKINRYYLLNGFKSTIASTTSVGKAAYI